MCIGIFYVKTADKKQEYLRIGELENLTGKEALQLREKITELAGSGLETIYIDAGNVDCADLAGIHEIIHSHYVLAGANKKLVFTYRQHSSVEKWVNTTGLDRFVATALLPAN